MKKQLWVITVILIIQLILFSLVGVYIWYTFIIDEIKQPFGNDNSFRYGPVLLKFDEEWVMSNGTQRFIRVAFDKYSIDDDDIKYDKFAPESLAISTSSALIKDDDYRNGVEIQYFDVPVESNEIWLDLYLSMVHTITDSDNKLHDFYTDTSYLYESKEFYFYHPTKKKWGGSTRMTGYSIWQIDESVYNRDFKSSFEFEKNLEIYRDRLLYDSDFAEEVINKRVLRLPPTKALDDKKLFLKASGLFEWFDETTEEELKKAEDDAAKEADDEFDDDFDDESDE